jgi:hypothetical protein
VAKKKIANRATNLDNAASVLSSRNGSSRQNKAADAYDMATLAAEMVAATGSATHLGIVSPEFGRRHAFCVAGYEPHDRVELHVKDMSEAGWCANAWVIDPWLNVSCPFHDYPKEAKKKFRHWSNQKKYTITREYKPPEDPLSESFQSMFFEANMLRFFEGSLLVTNISRIREAQVRAAEERQAEIYAAKLKQLPFISF